MYMLCVTVMTSVVGITKYIYSSTGIQFCALVDYFYATLYFYITKFQWTFLPI